MKKCRKADDCLKHKTCLKFPNEIITAPTIAQGKTVSELPRNCEESEGELVLGGDYLQTTTVTEKCTEYETSFELHTESRWFRIYRNHI